MEHEDRLEREREREALIRGEDIRHLLTNEGPGTGSGDYEGVTK